VVFIAAQAGSGTQWGVGASAQGGSDPRDVG
jgi:hypothetical protein